MTRADTGTIQQTNAGNQNFQITLSVTVRDAEALWRMAAARALAVTGLDCLDVEDILGPIEDPQVADCLSMLLAPAPVAGCVFTNMGITPASSKTPKSARSLRMTLGSPELALAFPRPQA